MFRITSQEDREPRRRAPFRSISTKKLETLIDLLDAIRQTEPECSHSTKMLGATVAHLAICLGEPSERIFIRTFLDARPGLKAYLNAKGFRRNSVRSYINCVRILIGSANELGWVEYPPELVTAWQEIRQLLRKAVGCSRPIDFAIAKGKSPGEFTDSDLIDWEQQALKTGLSFEYVRIVKGKFRKLIVESPLKVMVPNLSPPLDNTCGVPFSQLPDTLRDETTAVSKWKTDEFSVGRPRRARVRLISAGNLKREICRIFDFLQKIEGKTVSTLGRLLTEECITPFVAWCLNERGASGHCVEIDLARICGLRYTFDLKRF